jgi:hypothetical protein
MPRMRNGDGASMRRRDLKRELIRALADRKQEPQPAAAGDICEKADAITGSQLIRGIEGIAVSYRTERLKPNSPPTFIAPAGCL